MTRKELKIQIALNTFNISKLSDKELKHIIKFLNFTFPMQYAMVINELNMRQTGRDLYHRYGPTDTI